MIWNSNLMERVREFAESHTKLRIFTFNCTEIDLHQSHINNTNYVWCWRQVHKSRLSQTEATPNSCISPLQWLLTFNANYKWLERSQLATVQEVDILHGSQKQLSAKISLSVWVGTRMNECLFSYYLIRNIVYSIMQSFSATYGL